MSGRLLLVYFLVFLLSALPLFEAYFVIPAGVLGGLNPLVSLAIGLAGNILTVLLAIVFIDQIKNWWARRKKHSEAPSKRSQRADRLFKKYGVPGLAILGPLFVGSHLTAILAVSLGGARKAVFVWVTASIVLWSILFTVLISFGIDLMGAGDRQFLRKFLDAE